VEIGWQFAYDTYLSELQAHYKRFDVANRHSYFKTIHKEDIFQMTANNLIVENKSGFVIFRPNLLQRRIAAKKHTIVVAGASRGGTSSISYALVRSGFLLGEDLGHLNYEDKEIINARMNKQKLRRIFSKRNSQHNVWGFKLPEASFHLDWLDIELRNPIFVYVMRNPASVARSVIARSPAYEADREGLIGSLNHALRFYTYFTESLKRIESPIILVEHEAIARSPIAFCKDFYACLGIEVSKEEILDIAKQMAEPGYKKLQSNNK
jgi:hypothetical protein